MARGAGGSWRRGVREKVMTRGGADLGLFRGEDVRL